MFGISRDVGRLISGLLLIVNAACAYVLANAAVYSLDDMRKATVGLIIVIAGIVISGLPTAWKSKPDDVG